ncbi:MAG: NTP transferase domain-containing protein [Saprospiraceae bacterium]|nr:NTP transferase domain-containing protein [Saprospiraceae bacterium]
MKAIIPVAGTGARLRPLTYTQPKPLIPVAGKPILSYMIEKLLDIGVQEFVFVIGYLGEKIKDFVEQTYPGIDKQFVVQQDRLGSGHAVWTAKDKFRDADEVVIFFGDVIIETDFRIIMEMPGSVIGVKKVQDPREFGIVELNDNGAVVRVSEKPRIPKSDLAMVGFYKITEVQALIDALDYYVFNMETNDELPLTDALMRMMQQGAPFTPVTVDRWFDCGKKEVLLETNALLLRRDDYDPESVPTFDNSIIIHPVSIGPGCQIANSIIGPHVTIGHNARISDAIVKDSIIGNFAALNEVILRHSVIGNDTSIIGMKHSLNIGDNTEIDFSER